MRTHLFTTSPRLLSGSATLSRFPCVAMVAAPGAPAAVAVATGKDKSSRRMPHPRYRLASLPPGGRATSINLVA